MKIKLVVAGSANEFKEAFPRASKIFVKHVYLKEHLKGHNDYEIVRVGTWYNRNKSFLDELDQMEARKK